MAFWEFGEHLAFLFRWTGIAWLATRIFQCRCEERRCWLNERGEALYRWCCPLGYLRLLKRFAARVQRYTEDGPCTACMIQSGLPISQHTCQRWLDGLVREGMLGTLTISGRKHYGQLSRCKTRVTLVE